ncbi:D-alanine--D-alanine ligase family protein [Patulibacter defluvii]|uniref:D-alanine--D-alanine ligase family protein n=1 Tax=Patulibacter defluvii TaxID=3095358 RepID=UPI002A74A70E|nr:D-alanine--D-alanine ligase family protein [Patulibacter sp. DM4]
MSKVAVLGGGRSSEHEVSLRSAASVAEGLRTAGHEVVAIHLARDGAWTTDDGEPVALVPGGGLLDCDVAFPVLHGPFGEDGAVQGLLELLDVPYVGAPVLGSAVCMDKLVSKDLMAAAGIPQVDYEAVHAADWEADRDAVLERIDALGLPVWIKPSRLGSSVGIAPARSADEVAPAVEAALRHDARVIVEASASGIEAETAVLGSGAAPEVSEVGQIVLTSDDPDAWYDYEAKYTPGGMELRVPAEISATAKATLRALAARAFTLSCVEGLARVDFFVDGETVLLNELNTLPGFTETSVYGKLWEASGLAYPDLVSRLVELAVERFARERAHAF